MRDGKVLETFFDNINSVIKDTKWHCQKEDTHARADAREEPTGNWMLPISLNVLNATSRSCRIIYARIADITRENWSGSPKKPDQTAGA